MSPQDPEHPDDEILSALLDGDAAGAGTPEVRAATHLGSCGRCAGRQAELAAARAALAAASVEPPDELARRRLVAGALGVFGPATAGPAAGEGRGGRNRWISRRPGLVGSAAAVVLALLVGVPFVVNDNGGDGATLSAQAPAAEGESADPFLGDLGDLGDRERLRLQLSGTGGEGLAYYAPREPGAARAPVASPAPAGGGTAGGRAAAPTASDSPSEGAEEIADATADSSAEALAAGRDTGRDRADTDACVAALLNGAAPGGRLVATGTGTFRGRPAVVAAFELSGGTVAFVADRSGCAVLDRFSL